MLGDAGGFGVFLNDAFNRAGGKATEVTGGVDGLEILAVIEEEWIERIGASVEIISEAFGGGDGNENWAVLAAFTADDELAAVEIDGITVEFD